MRGLLRVFGEAFDDILRYRHNSPSDAYLSGLLAKDHFVVFVALAGADVVGGLAACMLEKF